MPLSSQLTDTRGRRLGDLRISVTDRCNFRCSYCMPREHFGGDHAFLPRAELFTFEEIERVSRLLASLGVRKLRLTGGEPLLRSGLPRLVELLGATFRASIWRSTTNGSLLAALRTELGGCWLAARHREPRCAQPRRVPAA
ncbi:MAG: radical SAM protein [Polyangiaceae bacterium]